jgi:hypothetical protein
MGNQTPRNYISSPIAAGASFTELSATTESYFSVYVATEGLYLSIGHATPSVGTSVEVPAGSSFDLPTGVLGPIHVRSLTGTPTTAFVVSA